MNWVRRILGRDTTEGLQLTPSATSHPHRRTEDQSWFLQPARQVWVAVLFLMLIGVVVFGWVRIRGDQSSSIRRTELTACHRLNIVRAQDNHNQYYDYVFDATESQLVGASLKRQTGAIKRTAQQKQATLLFIRKLNDATRGKAWIPLTPCHQAVYGSFRAPPPRSFAICPAWRKAHPRALICPAPQFAFVIGSGE